MTIRPLAVLAMLGVLAACGGTPKRPAPPPCMTAEQLPPAQRAMGQAKNLPPLCPPGVGPDGARSRR